MVVFARFSLDDISWNGAVGISFCLKNCFCNPLSCMRRMTRDCGYTITPSSSSFSRASTFTFSISMVTKSSPLPNVYTVSKSSRAPCTNWLLRLRQGAFLSGSSTCTFTLKRSEERRVGKESRRGYEQEEEENKDKKKEQERRNEA